MLFTLLAAFLIAQSLPSPISASTSQAAAPPSITDHVVVSAALVDLPLSRVTDSVTVIPGDALRAHQTENLAGALRSVTGLGITASGGRGGVTSIFTRGGESDYTLVLVDGVPANEFGGSLNIAHLSLANVDRVEIVRGPQSALFGGGAIAGVVSLISAEGGPARVSLQAEAGSEALRRGSIDAQGSSGGWSFGGGVDHVAADGFTGISAAGEAITNDDYTRTEISGVVSRGIRAGGRARIAARWNGNDRGFPGPYGANPAGNYSGLDTVSRGSNDSVIAHASVDARAGRLAHNASASVMRLESDFISSFGDSVSSTRRASARYVMDLALATGGISAGAELTRESGRSTYILNRAGAMIPVERTLAGYFAETRGALGSRALFTAGARLEQIHRAAFEGDNSPFGARPDIDADTVWSFNPRVSAVVFLTPPSAPATTRLRAGYATGIKAPSAFELSSTNNPSLKPERNRSGEIAIEQTLANGALSFGASAFWNQYDDLIITVGQSVQGSSQYRSDNLSNSKARGVELSAGARGTGAFEGVSVRGGYTWLDTEILAADGSDVTGLSPFEVGDQLVRRPTHRAFLDASLARGSLTAFASLEARGNARDVEPSFGLFGGLFENPGYATSSAGMSWHVTRHITAFGRVTNLFDRQYEEILGFPAPGRLVAGGVRVAAGR